MKRKKRLLQDPPRHPLLRFNEKVRSGTFFQGRSGFAWRHFSCSFWLLAEGTGACGTLSCSMAVVAHAPRLCGYCYFRPWLSLPAGDLDGFPLRPCCSLAHGPCARTCSEVQRVWYSLFLLLEVCPLVTLQFVYSHGGFSIHDGVDGLTSGAADHAELSGPPPSPPASVAYTRQLCTVPGIENAALEWLDAAWLHTSSSVTVASDEVVLPLFRAPYKDTPPLPGWRHTSRPHVSAIFSTAFPLDEKTRGAFPLRQRSIRPFGFSPGKWRRIFFAYVRWYTLGLGCWQALSTRTPSPCPWCACPLTRETATPYFL